MPRKKREPTEFEKAVLAGIARACRDAEIRTLLENAQVSEQGNSWTDPRTPWRDFRRRTAEYIVADLNGEKNEPSFYQEKFFVESLKKWLNEDGHFYDKFRNEWKEYQLKFASSTVEQVIAALPFKEQREKRERGYRTDIESLVEKALLKRGEPYEFEVVIGFNLVDFTLPVRRIVIECDGEYWHSAENRLHDVQKTLSIEEQGWEVYRLRFTRQDVNQETADKWVNEILDGVEGRNKYRLSSTTQPPEIQERYKFFQVLKLVSDGQAKLLEEWSDTERDYKKVQLLNGEILQVSRTVSPRLSQLRKSIIDMGGKLGA